MGKLGSLHYHYAESLNFMHQISIFQSFLLQIGKGNGEIQILNVSTGKSPRNGVTKAAGRVLSLTYDAGGKFLWSADDKGFIFSFICDPLNGKLSSKYKK